MNDLSGSIPARPHPVKDNRTYSQKLKDPRWKEKREEILFRDGYTCRDCGTTESSLHVHHCWYGKHEPWDTPSKFLLTVCEFCHERRQVYENDGKELLGLIFAGCSINALESLAGSMAEVVKLMTYSGGAVNPLMVDPDARQYEPLKPAAGAEE